jgi:hypothetical protein
MENLIDLNVFLEMLQIVSVREHLLLDEVLIQIQEVDEVEKIQDVVIE